jgi:hypothetical protein
VVGFKKMWSMEEDVESGLGEMKRFFSGGKNIKDLDIFQCGLPKVFVSL